ncbi:MarR family transcriptional regulator [Sphaerisporangium sp. NPDC005289]|uniref:MarR family winged helix-turn-helix transcriptional regulator n=1 Tax=Sphaerisporangium sp. NPDC005289 TaxID=3155247 RepID=UPI0033B27B59
MSVKPHTTRGAETRPDGEAIVDALAQCAFVVTGALTRVGAEHDLSLTQLRVLGILRDRTLKMSELADFLGLERSTMSGLVERAERRGLLQRARNPVDSRAIDVSMTAAGLVLAEGVRKDLERALAPVTSRLNADERRMVARLLQRMLGR